MRRYNALIGLLLIVVLPAYAQDWTPQDSLRLRRLLDSEGEIELNPEALKELGVQPPLGDPEMSVEKPWMNVDTTLPAIQGMPKKMKVFTLYPYKPTTKYNWNPVYQKKIDIDKELWQRNIFEELATRTIYSDWAKTPFDKGIRKSVEEIEATGLRYRVTERANNMAVGSWQPVGGASGMDLMKPFTRDFWNVRGRKRRARALEALRTYGDSITVLMRKTPEVIEE